MAAVLEKGNGTRQVELVPVDQLSPNPKNARTHSPKQLKSIAAIIGTLLEPGLDEDSESRTRDGFGSLKKNISSSKRAAPSCSARFYSRLHSREYIA
jgi:hypothetical protein